MSSVPSDKVTDVAKTAADLPALATDAARALQKGADKIRDALTQARDTGTAWDKAGDDLMRALNFQSNSPVTGGSVQKPDPNAKPG
jgi:hypothetical protein